MRRSSFLLCAPVAAISIGLASPASADNETRTPPTVAPTRAAAPAKTTWYGWQTIAVDFAGTVALVGGLLGQATNDLSERPGDNTWLQVSSVTGLGVIGLGAPAIHATHHHWVRAAGSLGLRLGGSTLAYFIAALSGPHSYAGVFGGADGARDRGARAGAIVLLGASVLDAVIAFDRTPVASGATVRASRSLVPHVGLTRGGATFGLGGEL